MYYSRNLFIYKILQSIQYTKINLGKFSKQWKAFMSEDIQNYLH